MKSILMGMQKALLIVLSAGTLALLLFSGASGQTPQRTEDLPPPPPLPARPKPTATPYIPKDSDYDVVRVTSNLIIVPVSVTDAKGQPVLGLSLKDFRLEEEGRAQEIAQIGNPEQVPLEIAILLDISGSVNARLDFEKEAAARFLKQVLRPGDRATIFAIAITPQLIQTRTTAENASAILRTVAATKGPTAFYDTVLDAAQYLAQSTPAGHRRVIVVISDGEDNFSEKVKQAIGNTSQAQAAATQQTRSAVFNSMQQVVMREVQRAEVTFYSINPSGEALRLNIPGMRAQAAMDQIAQATGGASFVPDKLEDLEGVFRQIASELRSQYLLQYYSNDEAQSERFRRIRVQVPPRPDLRVRARQGYYPKRK